MSAHEDFYEFLGEQDQGQQRQQAYDNYKQANEGVGFSMNGYLISPSGEPAENILQLINGLKTVFLRSE